MDCELELRPYVSNGRITKPEGILRLLLGLDKVLEERARAVLDGLIDAVRESPHNKHALAGRVALVNTLLVHLPRLPEDLRPRLLTLLRLAGSQRFTVHDSRSMLAQLQRNDTGGPAAQGGPAAAASAATRSLELLTLLTDVVSASPSAATPGAFWDMGAGVLGATGFDLPADRLVALAAKGALTATFWVQMDVSSGLTTLFSLYDATGCGLQLQLQRAAALVWERRQT